MGENKTRTMVSSLLVIGMFLLASFSVMLSGFENVKATSSWQEETDSDFNQGTLEYTEINGTGASAKVQLINASINEWINKYPTGTTSGKSNISLATIFNTDKVLMYGGWDNNTWIYNISSNSWTKKVHVNNPSYRADLDLAGIYGTDKVLLFGGTINSDTWIYDLSDDKWTRHYPINKPSERWCHAMAPIWGTTNVMLFGGYNVTGNKYHQQTWVYKLTNDSWFYMNPSGSVPSARCYHGMAAVFGTDKVVLFGGNESGNNNDDETWVYDYSDNKWTKMSPGIKPSIREMHGLATIWDTDKVAMFGGRNNNNNFYNDTWVYDLSDDNWTKLSFTTEPSKRSTFGMAMVNHTNKIVLFGGWGPTGVYNETWVLGVSTAHTLGTYTSKAYNAGAKSAFKTLTWTATTSANNSVKFQLRSAYYSHELNWYNFVGPGGSATNYYTSSPATIWTGHNNKKWIQYIAYFHTNDINDTPTLDNVTIIYNNLPVAKMLSPSNNSNVLDNTPKFAWNFSDGDSPSQSAFQVVIDNDPRFLSINYDSGQQSTSNTSWQFPSGTGYTSLPNGTWYWKVRVKDSDGDWGRYSYAHMILIGIVPPTTTINIPVNNSKLKSLSGISGITSYYNKTQSVTKVEVCIKRMDGNYWNGTGWNNTQTWLLATGTDSWSYNTASISWDTGTTYRVQSKATDNHSKVENPKFGNVFTIDTTPPTSAVTNPINNSIIEDLSQIKGNASDKGGAGLRFIYITLFDTNTNLYWINGSWNGTKTWLRATGTANWFYNTTYVYWQDGHKYRVQSHARDRVNNVETPSWGIVFYISSKPKNITSTIKNVGNNSYRNTLKSITGTAEAPMNSNVTKVEVCIKYFSSNNYWTGTSWSSTLTWLLASGTTSWSYDSSAVNWSTNTKYHIRSRATDNKSRVENPKYGKVFTIDDITPTSSITYPTNNSVLKTLIRVNGTASDTGGAGLSFVEICIKRISDGKYWSYYYWSSTQKWMTASGSTTWSFPTYGNFTWNPGTYHIQSRARDKASNIETPSYGVVFSIQSNISSTINTPANNSAYNTPLTTISGNAIPTTGCNLTKVEITIMRMNDNYYWNGTGWTNMSVPWLLASGTSPWSYNPSSITWSSWNKYLIRSKATDNSTVVETPSYGNIFTYDTLKPTSTITTPANNTNFTALNSISGYAFDSGGAGIKFVQLSVKRIADGYYWSGSAWVYSTSPIWLMTTGTTSWTYNFISNVTWQQGNYRAQSRAKDKASNIEIPRYGNKFTINTSLSVKPFSKILSPINGQYYRLVNAIVGSAWVINNASMNISKVEVSIQRQSDNKYWNGSAWNNTIQVWLLAKGTTSWSYLTNFIPWTSNTQYKVWSKATDNLSNVQKNLTMKYFYIDKEKPSSTIISPANNTILMSLIVNGTASDKGGAGIKYVQISLMRKSDNYYWTGYNWSKYQVWVNTGSNPNWQYSLYNVTLTIGTYLLRSRAIDRATNFETPSFGHIFNVTSIFGKPISTITTPTNNSILNGLNKIIGTAKASGNNTLSKVETSIRRLSDGRYWTGSSWGATSQIWLLATGTSSWSYNTNSVTWTSGKKYRIQSRAFYNATTVENPKFGVVFTYDALKPSSSIIIPVNNTSMNSLSKINGTAYDSGGAGLKYVEISLNRNSDGKYWNGFNWTSTQTWLRASGKSYWIYFITNLTFTSGKYHVKSRARDNANNLEIPSYGSIFTITTGAKPSSSITAPSNNAFLKSLNKITGTAKDNSGTGLKHVEITIKCTNNNQYWSGTGWGSSETWLLASGKTSWSYGTSSVNWYSGSKYLIKSKATDNSNNIETPGTGVVFNIDTSKPISIINYPMNNANLNQLKIIYGNSTDLGGAGVKSLEISIKRLSDNSYWHGITWNTTEYWLSSTGTGYWWFNSTNVSWSTNTKYNIRSRAIDNADNTEVPSSGITFMFDNQPPSKLSISINLGAKTTKTRTVFLTLSATDTGSGVAQMSFSNDNKTWSSWEQFKTNKSYNLTSGDGLKTVYFRVKDKAGNIGGPVSDDITLDTTPPALMSLAIYQVKAYTNSRNVKLILKIKDIMPRNFKIAFSLDNRKWSNWKIVWSSLHKTRGSIYDITVNYTLPEGDGEKTIYFKLQDEAGNIVESGFETFILDTTPPENLEILINENVLYTNSENVVLTLNAIDSLSTYLTMSFSFDGEMWTNLEEFDNKKGMSLPSGDGDKKIYFRVIDEAGNFAEAYDTIILDTTPPHSVSLLINDGALNTNSPTVTLKIIALDDHSGLSRLSYSSDGLTWSSWEEFKDSISYPLSTGDGEKTIYVKVMDNAGNIAEVVSASIVYNKDTDSDGYPDDADAFPNDHAASIDSDNDGSPDYWNIGKSQTDSTTGLHLDSFPTDHAASVDTDGDKYPDEWNIDKSEADSTTNLKLDDFPNDPLRHTKSSPEGEYFGIFSIMIISVVIIIIIIAFLTIYRNKHKGVSHSYKESYSDDKTLWKLRNEIIHGKGAPGAELSESEIRERLKEKYRSGEISEYTYLTLRKP